MPTTVSGATNSGFNCGSTKQALAFCDLVGRKKAWGPNGTVAVHTSKSGKWTLITLTCDSLAGKVTQTYTVRV